MNMFRACNINSQEETIHIMFNWYHETEEKKYFMDNGNLDVHII
jgi:hypothetical protein